MSSAHNTLNLFSKTRYSLAEEDRLVNGLLVILQQTPRPALLSFFNYLGVPIGPKDHIRMQDHIPYGPDSIIDAEFAVIGQILVFVEAKVTEHQFDDTAQVTRYLQILRGCAEPIKFLLLLSSDKETPSIVQQLRDLHGEVGIVWRSWNDIATALRVLSNSIPATDQIPHFLISHFLAYLGELGLVAGDDAAGKDKKVQPKLRLLLSSVPAEKILLHLFHHGKGHLREICRDHHVGIGQTQRALERLTKGNILVKRKEGNLVVYYFNERNTIVGPLLDLVRVTYKEIPQEARTRIFSPKYTKRN